MTKRPYHRVKVAGRDWRPEEDAVIREFARHGAGWIHTYRLQTRTIHAISARRRVIEMRDGARLPRFYEHGARP